MDYEFPDFDATHHENQITLEQLDWAKMNHDTTILRLSLFYIVDVVVRLDKKSNDLLDKAPDYKKKSLALYFDAYKN